MATIAPARPAVAERSAIDTDTDGLPIGVQAIADGYANHTAIAVARRAHGAMQ